MPIVAAAPARRAPGRREPDPLDGGWRRDPRPCPRGPPVDLQSRQGPHWNRIAGTVRMRRRGGASVARAQEVAHERLSPDSFHTRRRPRMSRSRLCRSSRAARLLPPASRRRGASRSAVPFFDGESLAGWEGNPELFRVGRVPSSAGPSASEIEQSEFLCTTGSTATSSCGFRPGRPRRTRTAASSSGLAVPRTAPTWSATRRTWVSSAVTPRTHLGRVVRRGAAERAAGGAGPGRAGQGVSSRRLERYRIRAEGPASRSGSTAIRRSTTRRPTRRSSSRGSSACRSTAGPPAEVRYRNFEIEVLWDRRRRGREGPRATTLLLSQVREPR